MESEGECQVLENLRWLWTLSMGSVVASWLVCLCSDRAVRIQNLDGDIVLCSWLGLTLAVPLSTQVYIWVPVTLTLGVLSCNGLPSHPGGVEILLATSSYRNRDKLHHHGPLCSYSDFTFCLNPLHRIISSCLSQFNNTKCGSSSSFFSYKHLKLKIYGCFLTDSIVATITCSIKRMSDCNLSTNYTAFVWYHYCGINQYREVIMTHYLKYFYYW